MKEPEPRLLGASEKKVSRMGLGLAALGRPGYINLGHGRDLGSYSVGLMAARCYEMLEQAYSKGLRYFDAARSYGRAEAFLANWLQSVSPEDAVIGSKWGYTYTAGWQVEAEVHEVKEHSLNKLNEQWRASRALLDGHLDLYQIHSATLETGVLENEAVLARLAELKSEGVLIGLSVSGEKQAATLEKALDVSVDGKRLFDSVQATFNLFERAAGETLARAHREGLGVIVKEALANGRLTPRNTSDQDKMHLLEKQAKRLATTVDGLALAYVLHQPWADVVLSGAATVKHLESNLTALDVQVDDAALGVLETLAEPSRVYWQRRSSLPWT